MVQSHADRNLLFGILAVQFNFIRRDQLIDGMYDWLRMKSKPLDVILVERGALSSTARRQVDEMVDQFIRNHHDDPKEGLAALGSASTIREALEHVNDPELLNSLELVTRAPSVPATASYVPTLPTSERYRILRFHAEGNLGRVSVATDLELGREVALKEIQARHADNPASRMRFTLEAEITGGLEHPGIVPVYSMGRHADGRPFYAMRLIRGQSLHDAIAAFHGLQGKAPPVPRRRIRFDTLEFRQLLGRFVDICEAIEYAHRRGVLHRDLKPGNIMLGRYGETLVVDWGLAKPLGESAIGPTATASLEDLPPLEPPSGSHSSETVAGTVLGTPHYMSPEQAQGRLDLLGPATDVYSLGATLFHMLTGEPPVAGNRLEEILAHVRQGVLRRPRDLVPNVPRALEAICLKALATEPNQRYRSARQLGSDIERYLADEPVSAWSEPIAVRARRWMRKHPGGIAAAVVAVLVGGFAISAHAYVMGQKNLELTILADDLRMARDQARENEQEARLESAEKEQARQAAAVAKEAAEKRLRQIERGNAVLLTIFEDLDIRAVKQGTEPLEAVLTRRLVEAAKQLEGESVGDPLLVASLQDRLGTTLVSLGQPSSAIDILKQARSTRQAVLGAEHLDTFSTSHNLAVAYREAAKFEAALQLESELLPRLKTHLGDDHLLTLTIADSLASTCKALGQIDRALNLFEETLERRKARLGLDHRETLSSMNNLAGAYRDAGKVDQAIPLFEEALKRSRTLLGPEHPDVFTVMNNLAGALGQAGKLEQALPLYEEVLRLRRARVGADHPDTLTSMNNLAMAYLNSGRIGEALPLFEETLRRMKTTLGESHPSTLRVMNNLATAYHDAGQLDKARPYYEESLKLLRALLGPDHSSTISIMNNLASLYVDLGQFEKGLPLYEDTLRRVKDLLGADHPSTLSVMNNLATGYHSAGQVEKAVTLLEETVRLSKWRNGPEHPDTLGSLNNLALAYQASNTPQKALPLYQDLLRIRRAKHGDGHPLTLTVMLNLGHAYHRVGESERALPLLEDVVRRYQAALPAGHPDTRLAQCRLGAAYRAAQRLPEALLLLEQAATGMEARKFRHPHTPTVMAELVAALVEARDFAKAVSWQQRWLSALREQKGEAAPTVQHQQVVLGDLLLRQGKAVDAEPSLRSSLAYYLAHTPENWRTFEVQSLLGGVLLAQQRFAEAEPLLRKGYEGMKARAGALPDGGHQRLRDAVDRLIQYYEAVGKPEEAAKWRRERPKDETPTSSGTGRGDKTPAPP